jgi:CRP/FNR family transcriptional regulator, cyclic AMP receptor protein
VAQEDEKPTTELDRLHRFERVASDAQIREELGTLMGRAPLLADLDMQDVARLAAYVGLYRAPFGEAIIREGDAGDFMLLITHGAVDIVKQGVNGQAQHMARVGAGTTIGEMSMIDGEPRFATCVAAEPTNFAVLTRARMEKIVREEPRLGSKILVKIVALLSARLRQTSSQLMRFMEVGS